MGKEATIHLQESLERDQSTPSKRTEVVSEVNKEKDVNFSWVFMFGFGMTIVN